MKLCLASAEFAPLAKTGGLADVCAALGAYLNRMGHDIRILLPRYSSMDTRNLDIVPVDYMQNMTVRLGPLSVKISIDATMLPGLKMRIYLLRCPQFYDRAGLYTAGDDEHLRFALLSRAAIQMCQHMSFAPDIFHCHDWHTALIPLYLKTVYAWDRLFSNTRSVLTIHNIGYQGIFDAGMVDHLGLNGSEYQLHQDDLALGQVNFLKTGVIHADLLTTVSPAYAREIQRADYGMGLQDFCRARRDSLVGILNGVDYNEWDPENDPLIPHAYSSRRLVAGKRRNKLELMNELELAGGDERPLIGMVTRLTGQKGIDLVEKVVPVLLRRRQFALAVLGSGEPRYERFFSRLQRSHRDRICFYRGYSNRLAHWIEAASDLFLMPSHYEPCGLNQMYSQRYGTVPVVRGTGGLADSVELYDPETKQGTGIVFRDYNEAGLSWALDTALDLYPDKAHWRRIMRNGMAKDYSWEHQGRIYVDLFRQLAKTP